MNELLKTIWWEAFYQMWTKGVPYLNKWDFVTFWRTDGAGEQTEDYKSRWAFYIERVVRNRMKLK